MTNTNVAIRLKLFIEFKGISSSQFADKTGIPRPSLSQFLTGRNKKISDHFVSQIHSAYPELNIMWLLFSEGSMLNSGSSYNDNNTQTNSADSYNDTEQHINDGSTETQSSIKYDTIEGFGNSTGEDDLFKQTTTLGMIQFDTADDRIDKMGVNKDNLPNRVSLSGSGNSINNKSREINQTKSGFEEKKNLTNDKGGNKNEKEMPLSPSLNDIKFTETEYVEAVLKSRRLEKEIAQIRRNPRKVVQIMIYYDDSTFETFTPRD